jgi:hypothetical protein
MLVAGCERCKYGAAARGGPIGESPGEFGGGEGLGMGADFSSREPGGG